MSIHSFEAFDCETDKLVETITAWSNINSGSRNLDGLKQMAAALKSEIETLGVEVIEIPLPNYVAFHDDGTQISCETGPALRARCRPDAPRTVLLNGHYDTVFGPDHPFQTCFREGNHLRGPGVSDMKGGIAVLLTALRLLESSPKRSGLGWEILLTPDEELGSPSSADLIMEAARSGSHSQGLIFEPALPGGRLASSRMGSNNYLILVYGKAAHSGREFSKGRNAVVALSHLISRVDEMNHENNDAIINVASISGGGAINIVPGLASCRINIRASSSETLASIDKQLHSIVADLSQKEGFSSQIHKTSSRPPKPLTSAIDSMLNQVRKCAQTLGFELQWEATGGGSDGNNLAAAGLPTLDNLGVRGGGIHSSDEFLEIDSLPERAKLCAAFLLHLAESAADSESCL